MTSEGYPEETNALWSCCLPSGSTPSLLAAVRPNGIYFRRWTFEHGLKINLIPPSLSSCSLNLCHLCPEQGEKNHGLGRWQSHCEFYQKMQRGAQGHGYLVLQLPSTSRVLGTGIEISIRNLVISNL